MATDTSAPQVGMMLYGVVPSDVEPTGSARGVGDPPGDVTTVTEKDLTALVSEVPLDRPLGRPNDLTAYQRLLDGTAAVAPVLPVRFGTVLRDPDAVRQLLADQHDTIAPLLKRLEGRVEYVVRGRYAEDAVLGEILDADPYARRLREDIHERAEEETTQQRMALGERINGAIEAMRQADTQTTVNRLGRVVEDLVVAEPTHELDAVHVPVLVEQDRRSEFDAVLAELADEWDGRVELRRLGPAAPYDFVTRLAADRDT
ncbi:GvpL/GvpF family gas vesicle protein [Dactylosporangium aurantiacum]|uniref:GvpL/GvpF family gas vesicle protein n=1 Tax=Dactylosporangium aurantiacum TaxID=35754 RepID=A0A9Q9MA40_9ACTN|nr:GvpL/GvpF family gas vesicle protein [Dactylosporangium aurantiacum]MDG6107116.1 GvpL/GvpF family gas vesicle protein [Dactylosporangium aurantiacum]UWZ51413.1 GvpL/GvpF family gas vesicle protein [Dactylosporangium aurantiacum]